MHAALDGGINWLDTAPIYGGSDALVARLLKERRALIATKVGPRLVRGHAVSDLSPKNLIADCEGSLRRLGVETIDLLQVHWPCQQGTPLEESFAALMQLRAAGKIRHIGVCNYGPDALRQIRAIAPIVSLQTPYSLLRREAEQGVLAAAEGLSVLAYEGLCRGLLTGKHSTRPRFPTSDHRRRDPRFSGPRFHHAVRLSGDLRRVGEKVGVSAAAIALGWLLKRPGVSAVIVGMRTPAQVHDNLAAVRLLKRRKLWAVVEAILQRHGPPPPG